MKTQEIRQKFLEYFASNKHNIVDSSSLVPINDPTLLFTNAGMVQFKDYFLGLETPSFSCATSSQRCLRAGGKHNDLDNVGYTARHHTFFEMLGNFSFGDYFKSKAIIFAWQFLTEVIKLPKDKLWVTVYAEDDEAYAVWANEIGLSAERIIKINSDDNFWMMGDTGPCGPCSEIFYDHGEEIAGGLPGTPEEDGDRYTEVWNLVFMQYNRQQDGRLLDLPKPSVDTGMGLERLAAILQGVHSNYEIDLFVNLMSGIQKVAPSIKDIHALRVVSDHLRAMCFLLLDGVIPSNEGRGYVLRRIMRRAIRHAYQQGQKQPFLYKCVDCLITVMGEAYPELKKSKAIIQDKIHAEEIRFGQTIEQGLTRLAVLVAELEKKQETILNGDEAFKLYDTYGFPLDLTNDMLRGNGFSVDEKGFEAALELQRTRSRQASNFGMDNSDVISLTEKTEFTGYDNTTDKSVIKQILINNKPVEKIKFADALDAKIQVVLDKTPFYAESGGQIGDIGKLSNDSFEFEIYDTQKSGDGILHFGKLLSGEMKQGVAASAVIDNLRRDSIRKHHSATHLLHAALKKVLGNHVAQRGSLVEPERLRFDFSHDNPIDNKQIELIERCIYQQVLANTPVEINIMTPKEAKAQGATALFGEKYGSQVRVLTMGLDAFSKELCGGTHVARTGDVGMVKIISESGVSAGVRRIEALAGEYAFNWLENQQQQLNNLSSQLNSPVSLLAEKIQKIQKDSESQRLEISRLQAESLQSNSVDLIKQAKKINDIECLALALPNLNNKELNQTIDSLKPLMANGVICLISVKEDKIALVCSVSSSLQKRIAAGELIRSLAHNIGIRGGGKPGFAQAGGNFNGKPDDVVNLVFEYLQNID